MSLSDNREIVSRDDSYPTIYHTSVVKQRCVAAAREGGRRVVAAIEIGKGMCRGEATIEELSGPLNAVPTRNPLRR